MLFLEVVVHDTNCECYLQQEEGEQWSAPVFSEAVGTCGEGLFGFESCFALVR